MIPRFFLQISKQTNYFVFQSTFMPNSNEHLDALHDIKQMMERSSRFISLSGLSGIAAGVCALVAAYYISGIFSVEFGANGYIYEWRSSRPESIETQLITVAAITLVAAFTLAFIFTWMRSKKNGTPLWGTTAKRLLWNTAIPLIVGGAFVLKLLGLGMIGLIAPCCLLFYGLALINGSKYTLQEVRWLGYCQIILGLINLWYIGYGLVFWALGFGVLHIIYGAVMWWKYEKK